MDNSTETITDFGEALIKELGVQGTDTLERWMAHHIADLIYRAEASEGIDKVEAERECKDAILQLWRFRSGHVGEFSNLGRSVSLLRLLRSNPLDDMNVQKRTAGCEITTADGWFELTRELRQSFEELQRTSLEIAARKIPTEDREILGLAKRSSLLDKDSESLSTLILWSDLAAKRATDWAARAVSAKDSIDQIFSAIIEELERNTHE